MAETDFKENRKLESKISIEKWSGDLRIEVAGTGEDHIKMLVGYILNVPDGAILMMEAARIASGLVKDREFMKGLEENTVKFEKERKTNG